MGEPAGMWTPSSSDVAHRRAADAGERRLPAEALLDRDRHERAVVAERGELLGPGEQAEHEVARRPVGGLGAGREQQPQERDDLLVGEALPVELGLGEDADHVVAGVLAAVGDHAGEEVVQPLRRLEAALDVEADADELDRLAVELRQLVGGQAEHARDDVDRERPEELADQVGASLARRSRR